MMLLKNKRIVLTLATIGSVIIGGWLIFSSMQSGANYALIRDVANKQSYSANLQEVEKGKSTECYSQDSSKQEVCRYIRYKLSDTTCKRIVAKLTPQNDTCTYAAKKIEYAGNDFQFTVGKHGDRYALTILLVAKK